MKFLYRKSNIALLLFMLSIVVPAIASAQFDPFPDGGNPDNAPIDGGISLLVAAGVGYGAKKLNARKRYVKSKTNIF